MAEGHERRRAAGVHVEASPVHAGGPGAGGCLHLIDEATCASSPVRAAWLADHMKGRAGDGLYVFSHGEARWARRAGLRATKVFGRRLPLGWKAAMALRRLRSGAGGGAWGAVCDWSLGGRVRAAWSGDDGGGSAPFAPLPPVTLDADRLREADRVALRAGWEVSPGAGVAWLAADVPGSADVMLGAAGTGLASEAGREWAIVVSPGMAGVPRARRLVAAMGRPARLIVDERAAEPWRVMAGCDAALVLRGNAALSMRWAAMAGLTLVTTPETASGVNGLSGGEGASAAWGGEPRVVTTDDARSRSIARVLCRLSEGSVEGAG